MTAAGGRTVAVGWEFVGGSSPCSSVPHLSINAAPHASRSHSNQTGGHHSILRGGRHSPALRPSDSWCGMVGWRCGGAAVQVPRATVCMQMEAVASMQPGQPTTSAPCPERGMQGISAYQTASHTHRVYVVNAVHFTQPEGAWPGLTLATRVPVVSTPLVLALNWTALPPVSCTAGARRSSFRC